jgi:hypothetical protein
MTTRRSLLLLLSPVGVLLISAGRLIIVANFNTTTAVTIASSGGFVNTLLGSIIPLVPVFIPYLALLLLLFRRFLLSIMTFVFAAFISSTSIRLSDVVSLAKTDWTQLVAKVTDYRMLVIWIALAIFAAAWMYNRSFAEGLSIAAAMVVAAALLVALPIAGQPPKLRLASNNVHRMVGAAARAAARATGSSRVETIEILVLAAVVFLVLMGPRNWREVIGSFSWLLIGAIAVVATLALFPYVHYIYPVPQDRNYYEEATHAMWLPSERIVLTTRSVYDGYVLKADQDWFTVLLVHNRTIVYLRTGEVVSRSVCQPEIRAQPKQYPPLIPWLYNRPSPLPPCPGRDMTVLGEPLGHATQPEKTQTQRENPDAELPPTRPVTGGPDSG